MRLAESGFLTGYEDKMIRPGNVVTRAEAVTILNRMTGKMYPDTIQNPFSDIDGHWAHDDDSCCVQQLNGYYAKHIKIKRKRQLNIMLIVFSCRCCFSSVSILS